MFQPWVACSQNPSQAFSRVSSTYHSEVACLTRRVRIRGGPLAQIVDPLVGGEQGESGTLEVVLDLHPVVGAPGHPVDRLADHCVKAAGRGYWQYRADRGCRRLGEPLPRSACRSCSGRAGRDRSGRTPRPSSGPRSTHRREHGLAAGELFAGSTASGLGGPHRTPDPKTQDRRVGYRRAGSRTSGPRERLARRWADRLASARWCGSSLPGHGRGPVIGRRCELVSSGDPARAQRPGARQLRPVACRGDPAGVSIRAAPLLPELGQPGRFGPPPRPRR